MVQYGTECKAVGETLAKVPNVYVLMEKEDTYIRSNQSILSVVTKNHRGLSHPRWWKKDQVCVRVCVRVV